jgi:periplasmic divalent cation tolerance protein
MIEIVYTVCSSVDEAKSIGKALVEEKICACVNIIPGMHSIYFWEGELVQDQEVVLLIKSVPTSFKALSAKIKEMHSYEIPAIFTLHSKEVDANYLKWVKGNVQL